MDETGAGVCACSSSSSTSKGIGEGSTDGGINVGDGAVVRGSVQSDSLISLSCSEETVMESPTPSPPAAAGFCARTVLIVIY